MTGRQALPAVPCAKRAAGAGERWPDVEQRLKDLIKQLGSAIDESLSRSQAISEVIGEIKKEGYDVLLVLEATIGFNRRSDEAGKEPVAALTHQDLDSNLTEQDQRFLKALCISLSE